MRAPVAWLPVEEDAVDRLRERRAADLARADQRRHHVLRHARFMQQARDVQAGEVAYSLGL